MTLHESFGQQFYFDYLPAMAILIPVPGHGYAAVHLYFCVLGSEGVYHQR